MTEKMAYEISEKGPKVADYDFRQPQRLFKDQLGTVEEIYRIFGQSLATSLGAHARIPLEVKVEKVRQLPYSDFMSSLAQPLCLGIIDIESWKGLSLVEVSTNIILTIIDRLLGGQGEIKGTESQRGLTEIELEVAKGIFGRMMENIRVAWADIDQLSLKLKSVITSLDRAQIFPPEEVVIVAVLGIKTGNLEGIIRHCIPHTLIEPITERLTPQYKYSAEQEMRVSAETVEKLRQGMQEVPITVIAELGVAQIGVGDILGLQVGDVLKLTTKADGNLILKVGDRKKFLCRPGVIGNKIAVQVTQVEGKE